MTPGRRAPAGNRVRANRIAPQAGRVVRKIPARFADHSLCGILRISENDVECLGRLACFWSNRSQRIVAFTPGMAFPLQSNAQGETMMKKTIRRGVELLDIGLFNVAY
jgi:hypothetical protein